MRRWHQCLITWRRRSSAKSIISIHMYDVRERFPLRAVCFRPINTASFCTKTVKDQLINSSIHLNNECIFLHAGTRCYLI